MFLRLTILNILIAANSFGQIEKDINYVLQKRDFQKFLQFADKYKRDTVGVRIDKGNVRELTKGFQEAMFYITKSYPINKGVSITCNPRLNLIIQGNKIIYFYLDSKEMKDIPRNFEITSDTTYEYIDSNQMVALRKEFEFMYKSSLNEKELFVDTIAVGSSCGHYPGQATKQQEQISQWINMADTVSLFKWLQSTNSEKQAYAVQGFHTLALKGIKISDEAKTLIRQVGRKKGTINTCIPCDSRQSEISKVLKPYML